MAFKRRGNLVETMGFMSYIKHDEWRRHLWKAMNQDITWANESAPGIQDILRAGAKVWHFLPEACVRSPSATRSATAQRRESY